MKDFSTKWKSSRSKRKQRKYRLNAPLHIKGKFMKSTLSKDLRKKYGVRNLRVRKGDKVRIMRGQFRKTTGRVENVDLKKEAVFVAGAEFIKKDGSKSVYPIHPSKIMIVEANIDDKERKKIVDRKKKPEVKTEVKK
ncbi:MAG TPA: 50S ribosomal protein L24 [Candidatus Nanoarchaeia archaeon]|nr:50S ribosomal protein L24 [Candidatus Nanoarchaeia archaeon]